MAKGNHNIWMLVQCYVFASVAMSRKENQCSQKICFQSNVFASFKYANSFSWLCHYWGLCSRWMETYFTLSAAHSEFTQWAVRLWDIHPSTPVSGQLHLGKHLKLSHTCGCPVQLSEGVFMWSGLYRSGNETAPSLGSLQRERLQTGVLIAYHTLVTTMATTTTTTTRKHGWKKYAARLIMQNCIKLNNPRMTVLEEMCGLCTFVANRYSHCN